MSKVYFIAANKDVTLINKLKILLERADISNLNGVVALKMHMGERNNKTFVKPAYIKKLVDVVKTHGGDPFVTDTTTIYKAGRYTAMDYYRTAFAHGFLPSYLGCPVIIADGLKDERVEVNERVDIAKGMAYTTVMRCFLFRMLHTGHGASSFGGAIKNIAMGCVTEFPH